MKVVKHLPAIDSQLGCYVAKPFIKPILKSLLAVSSVKLEAC